MYELTTPADGRPPFYTMRHVEGPTLTVAVQAYHACRQAGRPAAVDLLRLLNAFVTVCQAVAYAHSQGVLHRDLKGGNVVLGDFGEVVVLDWGLAKVLGSTDPAGGPAAGAAAADGHTLPGCDRHAWVHGSSRRPAADLPAGDRRLRARGHPRRDPRRAAAVRQGHERRGANVGCGWQPGPAGPVRADVPPDPRPRACAVAEGPADRYPSPGGWQAVVAWPLADRSRAWEERAVFRQASTCCVPSGPTAVQALNQGGSGPRLGTRGPASRYRDHPPTTAADAPPQGGHGRRRVRRS